MGSSLTVRDVTCHMGSHSVTCYLTQVNAPRLNPPSMYRKTEQIMQGKGLGGVWLAPSPVISYYFKLFCNKF